MSYTFTRYTSKRVLAKRLRRQPDGSLSWEASANLSKGRAETLKVDSLETLAECIQGTTPRQAIGVGVIRDGRTTAPVALKAAIEEGTAPAGAIARSIEHLRMPSRGLLPLDVDDGEQPQAVIDHLCQFDESLKGVKWLAVGSSRYHVTDPEGRTVTRKGGWHLYALAEGLGNLTDYARAYETWAKENGYAKQVIDAAGRQRWEYPIDTAVWKSAANRLIFESVALPKGYQAAKPIQWINSEGGAAVIRLPAAAHLIRQQKRQPPDLAAFNADADMPALLERLGYRDAGRGLWFTPGQNDRTPAAQLYDDGRVYHRGKELSGQNLDALGLIAHWEFNSDFKAAAAALRASNAPDNAEIETYRARCNVDSMSLAAQRYMTAYFQHDDDLWLGMAALYDGVEQRCSINDWCKRHRQNPRIVARVLADARRELWGAQHRAPGAPFTRHESVPAAAQAMNASSASSYLQAPLGAGKTEKALAPIIAQHSNVLVINHLRALSSDLANRLDAQHYQQAEALQPGRLVTTVHSLTQPRVIRWIQDADPTLIVIDEAASVADVLGQPGGNMSDTQQAEALQLLQRLARLGVRFILADGDCPESARILAGLADVTEWHRAPGEYEQPRVEIHQGVSVETTDEKHRIRRTPTHPLSEAIRASNSLALFCDTRTDVEAWASRLGCLGIHGENSGDPEQAAFLTAPDRQAVDRGRVVYNSVLGAGVSITSAERDVIGVYTGHLAPRAMWQALRRWRRASDGVIKIQTTPGACVPKRQQAVTDSMEWLQAQQELDGAPGIGSPLLAWHALRAAYCAETDRWTRNPQQAFVTYLEEAGIDVTVVVDSSAGTDTEHDTVKQEKKAERLQALAQAKQITDRELAKIQRQARKTSDEAMQERRAVAARALHLDNSDLTPQGHLREPLAKAILQQQLERRAGLAAYVWMDGYTVSLMDEEGRRRHHLRWQIVTETMRAVGIDPLAPEATGRPLTRLDVLALVERLDAILPSKGRLPLLRAAGLPELPRTSASKKQLAVWTREWFTRMGLTRVKGGRSKVTIEGERLDASTWKFDLMAACFAQRIAAHRNVTIRGIDSRGLNPAESPASRAFQVSPTDPHTLYTWGQVSDICIPAETVSKEACCGA
ncbi:DEAD/DEAH box helicase family protein [Vreelandella salicampi]|uniref:DEAD/DEAH box helicase family protein n=1 Tax=Vreelandella salicampi TaxID=1449798 RepID=A0A7Z0LP93_9GAMM|nr:DEAD/DEAH box helicase family protein [Halomonas salicampi]NYS62598.1 DEAD/DEAH box helicase family protein [Halomonas salicampi]